MYESLSWSYDIISFSISNIMLITPAFRIFIWGFPTFHWIAGINSFLIICYAMGLNPSFIVSSLNNTSINTNVSILNYI